MTSRIKADVVELLFKAQPRPIAEQTMGRHPQRVVAHRGNLPDQPGDAPRDADDGGIQTVQTVRRQGEKIGRNAPCPCGSGKKYKRCHGI